ncbi:MAG: hypothetical protein A2Z46_06285 [Nitrospirae bacterium RBG_19FT_COMBO_55_12]|nr:MAG: hypothetical protein A2Z46_06285 [Nitrospirae bacterium RBG_19FT_COMBO_55_12]
MVYSKVKSCNRLSVTEAGKDQIFLVASPGNDADAYRSSYFTYTQIAEVLESKGMEIVQERIFGNLSFEPSVLAARTKAFEAENIPANGSLTYVHGNPPYGERLAGVQIQAVKKGNDVWTIMDGNIPCGRKWIYNGLTYLVLQNIQSGSNGSQPNLAKPLQARLMIERADRILRENGASYGDVVRTWFYLSDILDWYAGFNKVRNEKYGEFGIMPGPGDRRLLLPASTGIQGEIPSGAACTMDLIAVLGSNSAKPNIKKLSNPIQFDAFRYGSAFARGSVIKNGSTDLIEVSGTAAIDEHGVSLYPGDIHSQIDCTLDKVQALLEQAGAGLRDICSATVFIKQPEFAEIFYEIASARGLEDLPCICVVADVCREELLFEMDAEVVA